MTIVYCGFNKFYTVYENTSSNLTHKLSYNATISSKCKLEHLLCKQINYMYFEYWINK